MVGDDSSESLAQHAAPPEDAGSGDPLGDTLALPAGVTQMGAALADLPEALRAQADRLGLAALLDPTPPVWLWLPKFRVGRQLVTNGQYRTFLEAVDPEKPHARIFDSRSLWEYVWQQLGFGITSRRVPIREGNQLGSVEETYDDCGTFVAAYVRSLRRDIERLLAGASLDGATPGTGEEGKFRALGRQTMVLAMPHHPLARSVFDDLSRALDEGRQPSDPGDLARRIEELIAVLEPALRAARDPRRPDTRPPQPEAMIILRRTQAEAARGEPLLASRVIFPREWSSARGPTGLRFPGPRVPWEEQAVVGITLYEAAGYAAWLSLTTGRQVGLPNEAEWERAASWPVDGGAAPASAHKALWPWWNPDDERAGRDFTHYFGHEGGSAEGLYGDRREYRRILEATARPCSNGGALAQFLGFGFQWTCDRFDPRERRYARFSGGRYPTAPSAPGLDTPAFHYRPVADARHLDFVLRGAPALVGGPGLTTRRFAACPLRASRDIGFRIVVRED